MNDRFIPGVSEYGRHIKLYAFGKPGPARIRDRLLEQARNIMSRVTSAEKPTAEELSYAWHMRAAADAIDDLMLEVVRLSGT